MEVQDHPAPDLEIEAQQAAQEIARNQRCSISHVPNQPAVWLTMNKAPHQINVDFSTPPQSPGQEEEDETEYYIDYIDGVRIHQGEIWYRVKWTGYER